MELFINQAPVGVSPAEGDTVLTLIRAVEQELDKDLIIATLLVDGEYASVDDPAVLSRPVSSITKAEMTVATRSDIGVGILEDAKRILESSARELKTGAQGHKKEIMQGIGWIMESLDALAQSQPFPPSGLALLHGAAADILRILGGDLPPEEQSRLGDAIEGFIPLFTALQQKLAHPPSKGEVYQELQGARELLPKIASHFQTGRDIEALGFLGTVLDALELYVRFSAQEDQSQAEEIRGLSSQLLEAFENKDYILIADLMEYDLGDHLDTILNME